jgi:diguanylate cyclase (GGDEF)-like protein
VLGAVVVFRDVSSQRSLAREMSHRAKHDALTGLINRGEFEDRLQRVLTSNPAETEALSPLYLDLDQFKIVNDTCGHAAGDALLRQISELIRSTVRGTDTVARLGGDEFAILLERCPLPRAEIVGQTICDRIDAYRFVREGRTFCVGASIGVVPLNGPWASGAALLRAADLCCYAAKEAGRNRVHHWTAEEPRMVQRQGQMQWVNRLGRAIDEDHFELFAQRVVPLQGAEDALRCEMLLRLREPDGNLVSPGTFLPAAERFHMATRIDKYVMSKLFGTLAGCNLSRVASVALSLSGQSIGDPAFHAFAAERVAALLFDPSKLIFELTETAAVGSPDDALEFIRQTRAAGIRIALDDCGAGTASFGYLRTLPVDVLKIDGQFILNLVDDALDLAAVRSFLEVARVIGADVVAEWIETEAVETKLRDLGVEYGQGFLRHRPEPLRALLHRAAGQHVLAAAS